MQDILNLDIWLAIKKREAWEFEITFDGVNLNTPALNMPKEYNISYSVSFEDGSTVVCFKGANV